MSLRPDGTGTRWSDYTLAVVESASRKGDVHKVRVAGQSWAQKLKHMSGNVHVLRISAEYAQEAARKLVVYFDDARQPVYWQSADDLRSVVMAVVNGKSIADALLPADALETRP
jgi:hypothetical protein